MDEMIDADSDDGVILTATDVMVRSGAEDSATTLISGISLTVAAGEVIDLAGPSGCGKTTLLLALSRLHPFATATLTLDGRAADGYSPQEWRSRVAYLPQKAALAEGTIGDALLAPFRLAVRTDRAKPTTDEMRSMLYDTGLGDIGLDHGTDQLSVGQAARIALCRTLLTEPEVLLLDEVDAALDSASVELIGTLIGRYVASGRHGCLRIRHREPDAHTTRGLVFFEGSLIGKEIGGVQTGSVQADKMPTNGTQSGKEVRP